MIVAFSDFSTQMLSFSSSFMVIVAICGFVVHFVLAISVWMTRPPRVVLVPTFVWGLAVLFGGVTAAGIFWVLHFGLPTRSAGLNLCPKCNYDRAGLAAGAKCPECGHAE
jgi:hypothetical protein